MNGISRYPLVFHYLACHCYMFRFLKKGCDMILCASKVNHNGHRGKKCTKEIMLKCWKCTNACPILWPSPTPTHPPIPSNCLDCWGCVDLSCAVALMFNRSLCTLILPLYWWPTQWPVPATSSIFVFYFFFFFYQYVHIIRPSFLLLSTK